ncbi:MAG: HAD hydrolase-like protein [Candidatus Limnocylindrales bacterium]
MRSLPDPDAIAFDLDGTLVDTVETRIAAWMRVFGEQRISADRGHVARLIGADGKRLAREIADVAGKRIDDDRAEAIDKRSGEIYNELNTNPRPIRGARPLLLALTGSRLPWAIATSSRREQVMTSVEALGLSLSPRIVDGSHVKHAKPAPDLLLLAAQQLHTRVGQCWYVGDSTWDMLASKAAGMTGVAVSYGAASKQDLLGACASAVTNFRALLDDLRRRGLVSAGQPLAVS